MATQSSGAYRLQNGRPFRLILKKADSNCDCQDKISSISAPNHGNNCLGFINIQMRMRMNHWYLETDEVVVEKQEHFKNSWHLLQICYCKDQLIWNQRNEAQMCWRQEDIEESSQPITATVIQTLQSQKEVTRAKSSRCHTTIVLPSWYSCYAFVKVCQMFSGKFLTFGDCSISILYLSSLMPLSKSSYHSKIYHTDDGCKIYCTAVGC